MARAVMGSMVDELLAGRSPGPTAHSIKESADIARAEPSFAVGNKVKLSLITPIEPPDDPVNRASLGFAGGSNVLRF